MKRRNTATKQKVLQAFKKENRALSHEMLQASLDSIDRATIYRILNRFHEDGVVHKILGADGKQYFALCVDCEEDHHRHDHFHFQCSSCQKMECMEDEVSVSIPQGYQFQSFRGLIVGICSDCA